MNIARIAAAVSVAGATLGLAVVHGSPASASAVPAATEHTNPRPVVVNCSKAKVTRPSSLMLACGDGTESLIGLHWSSWQLGHAAGHGTDAINLCVPDCAQSKARFYPVHVTLSGSAAVHGVPGERRYTRYTLTYTRNRPPSTPRVRTGLLGA